MFPITRLIRVFCGESSLTLSNLYEMSNLVHEVIFPPLEIRTFGDIRLTGFKCGPDIQGLFYSP